MILEIWKDVVEYPNRFMVSNHGRVWSKKSNRILVQGTTIKGYKVISSKIGGRDGTSICKRVHRWVAEAFLDNPDDKPFVNHIDGDKTNNFVWNLEWCTASENSQHSFDSGLQAPLRGEKAVNSKLTDDAVRFIRKNHKPRCRTYGVVALARMFGVHHQVIRDVIANNIWKHVT